jgi:hypothetical protein
MEPRRPAEDIVRDLETTSAKIRELARAGYDRTEISRQLGIAYQHVRKVLLDAGITDGLRRKVQAEREPVVLDAPATQREAVAWDILLTAGFQFIGEWTEDPLSALKLDAVAPLEAGVYAFVVDDLVAYIGITNNTLRTRFDQYRRGHEGQRTNARVKKLILEALAQGKRVKVLVAIPQPLEWHGLPVNTAAGLEAGLIQMLRPIWNITGTA